MEMICEFCKSPCPVVYCTADAAYLCLSCDSKVHSANALSHRHNRSLVCQSCMSQPAYVRCLERHVFMCQSCFTTGHASFQQRKSKVISSYMGSPSAKELAVLWGFDLNEFESEQGSSNQGTKVGTKTCVILEQILDLEKLQLSGSIGTSRSLQAKERMNFTRKMHKTVTNRTDHIDRCLDFHEPTNSPYDEGESLHGELFWQCESPSLNNQSWFNMQDIGVCEEVQCFDDISIPEVDLTFRNFEELFGSENENASTIEDVAGDIPQSYNIYKQIDFFDKIHRLETVNSYLLQTKSSYPASSFSVSRINGEQNVMKRNKEKKVLRREEQAQYTSHRSKCVGKSGKGDDKRQ